jgi:hypothetical protein
MSATIPVAGGRYAPTSIAPSVESLIAEPPIAPPYMHPPTLSGPYEKNVDGDATEIVMNRLPREGINITYCKAVGGAVESGPSFAMQPNNAQGNQTPLSGRTVLYGDAD